MRPVWLAIAAITGAVETMGSSGLGGAVAGRPIAIRYVDNRNIR